MDKATACFPKVFISVAASSPSKYSKIRNNII